MYNEQFTLHGKAFKETDGGIILTPQFNTSIDFSINNKPEIDSSNNHQFIHHDYSNEFGKMINKLQKQRENIDKISFNHNHYPYLSIFLLMISIAMIFSAIFAHRKKIKSIHQRYVVESRSHGNSSHDSTRHTLP